MILKENCLESKEEKKQCAEQSEWLLTSEFFQRSGRNSRFKCLVGFIISLICIVALSLKFDWRDFRLAFQNLNTFLLIVSGVLVIMSYLIQTIRWRILLNMNSLLSFPRGFRFLLIGCLGNVILPFRAGDIIRIYMIRRAFGSGATTAFGSIIIERLFDVFAMLIFGSIIGLASELPADFTSAFIFMAILGMIGGIFVLLIAFLGEKIHSFLVQLQEVYKSVNISTLINIFAQLIIVMRVIINAGQFIRIASLSLIAWGVIALAMWFFITAFGVYLPLAAGGLLMVTTHLGAIIPSAPASIGVYHALTVITLAVWKIDGETAMAIALISHGVIVGIQICGGAISMWIEGKVRSPCVS